YSGFARVVLAQTGKVFAVFDDRICKLAQREDEFKELLDYGGIKRLDLSAALEATIDTYNSAARGDRADPFGRTAFAMSPLQPPFWTAQVVPGLFHTQGGLRTDADARVLSQSGTPIPNLFAGGGAAAGISGRSGALGYLSGNGLLSALGLGYLAARTAAA